MITRDQIVAEARSWIGTPYVHQASAKGAGTDCLGLVRGVWRALIGYEPESVPSYTSDWSETTGEEALMAAACRWLDEKATMTNSIGDVLLFRMRDRSIAKHLGISAMLGGRPTFIHAYTGHGVVETSLSLPWVKKIAGRFEFPLGAQ